LKDAELKVNEVCENGKLWVSAVWWNHFWHK